VLRAAFDDVEAIVPKWITAERGVVGVARSTRWR